MAIDLEKWTAEMDQLTKTLRNLKDLGDDVTPWSCSVIIGVLLSNDKALQTVMVSTLATFSKILGSNGPDAKSNEPTFTHPGSSAVN